MAEGIVEKECTPKAVTIAQTDPNQRIAATNLQTQQVTLGLRTSARVQLLDFYVIYAEAIISDKECTRVV